MQREEQEGNKHSYLVLYLAMMRSDVDPRAPGLDERRRRDRLAAPHVLHPEQELPVQVRDVDGVKVDDVDVLHAGHGQVLEDLAAETAGADDQNAGRREAGGGGARVELTHGELAGLVRERAGSGHNSREGAPARGEVGRDQK